MDGNASSAGHRFIRNRHLGPEDDVFSQNAWDDVEFDQEYSAEVQKKIDANSSELVDPSKAAQYEEEASKFWNRFYEQHKDMFFKDRNWLSDEFPELFEGVESLESYIQRVGLENLEVSTTGTLIRTLNAEERENEAKKRKKVLEVGCGAGNAVFPLLQSVGSPFFVYCCDFSENAVNLVKSNKYFDPVYCLPFVCDVTKLPLNMPFERNSLDFILMIFTLSAICFSKMQGTISALVEYLKPGGMLLFRDYGRFDLSQVRFKNGQCIEKNFYVRGDGTRVYFFTQDELDMLFTTAGLEKVSNCVDRRLQVNRIRHLKMYRVWIQCKYRKPLQHHLKSKGKRPYGGN